MRVVRRCCACVLFDSGPRSWIFLDPSHERLCSDNIFVYANCTCCAISLAQRKNNTAAYQVPPTQVLPSNALLAPTQVDTE